MMFWWRKYRELLGTMALGAVLALTAEYVIAGGIRTAQEIRAVQAPKPQPFLSGKSIGADATQNVEDAVKAAAKAFSDGRIRNINIKITYAGDAPAQ